MTQRPSPRIKVSADGPYLVTGHVPLVEFTITPAPAGSYTYEPGRTFDTGETYALCRCGKSKGAPFCDGSHVAADFDGTERASREPYDDRAKVYPGPGIDLLDDGRCGLARFCHRDNSEVWSLTANSDNPAARDAAVRAACECPSGRLTAYDKDGEAFEIEYAPTIALLQDPERGVSCGLAVRGYIPIESADGHEYEVRNRVLLCRCGSSRNKPFCDASHVTARWVDSPADR